MSLVFDGLAQLQKDLLNLPTDLQAEAGNIVEAHANAAAARIKSVYADHWLTGELTKKVTVDFDLTTGVAASAVVETLAAAYFRERAEVRHMTVTGSSTDGRMPAPRLHARDAERRNMNRPRGDVRKGLTVTGDA